MGKKSGPEVVETRLPPEIEAQAKANLRIAEQASNLGYVPYRGPTIAGFSPQQQAGMSGVDQAAAAFGLPSAGGNAQALMQAAQTSGKMGGEGGGKAGGDIPNDPITGLPAPQPGAGGVSGYSGNALYDDAVANTAPGHRALIESFAIDPITGKAPANTAIPGASVPVDPKYGRTPEEVSLLEGIAAETPAPQVRKARTVSPYERMMMTHGIEAGSWK